MKHDYSTHITTLAPTSMRVASPDLVGSGSTLVPAVSVRHLRKTYADTVAVADVSFQVEPGQIFGILGPNGAGKTTTVEMVTGLRRADAGHVSVLGLDPWADRAAFTQAVGVQLQTSRLPDKIRVGEAVELYRSFYADPADGGELLERLGLSGSIGVRFAALSGGQQQRLAVALALIGRPRVAVLDELTTGLDPQARRETWELIAGIRDRGATVLLVTHFMEEAEFLSDRVAVIDRGRVVAEGVPAELVQRAGLATRVTFTPSGPFDEAALTGLAPVTALSRSGAGVTVTGGEDVLQAVVAALSRSGVTAGNLRVHQGTLDDAFLALTGASPNEATGTSAEGAQRGRRSRQVGEPQ